MDEFERLSLADKIQYGLMTKMNYYTFYRKRKALRGWRYLDRILFCPLCKIDTKIISVGFMNHVYWNKVIDHPRCEICLIKLPVTDKKILKLLQTEEKPKPLPVGQTILI